MLVTRAVMELFVQKFKKKEKKCMCFQVKENFTNSKKLR